VNEAFFVGGYASVLLVIALAMGWAARTSHDRILRTKTIGFRYHLHLNAWQCSEGTFLWHHETDEAARVVQYRAKGEICNACSLKSVCTDSDDGRTLLRPLDGWPHSEMARFQRVLSLSLMILAGMLCAVELARQGDVRIQVAFGSGAALSVFLAHREWQRVRAVRTALFGG
jgi:hypothetical protein